MWMKESGVWWWWMKGVFIGHKNGHQRASWNVFLCPDSVMLKSWDFGLIRRVSD